MGWLITFCILFLLAILPLGASAVYNCDGFFAYLIAGPLRIRLFPLSKKAKNIKPKKDKQKDKSDKKTKEKKNAHPEKEKSGGSVTDFIPLVKLALELLNDFRRKLRVNKLEVKLIMAGGDPCDLSVNYGKAWAAIGNLMPQLERFLVIKKRDIQVECDFVGNDTLIFVHVDLTITLGRILYLAVFYGIRAIREFIKINNKRKGGVNK